MAQKLKIHQEQGTCFRCQCRGSVLTPESVAVSDTEFVAGKYATPAFMDLESRLPRMRCPHCKGIGKEIFPVIRYRVKPDGTREYEMETA